MDIRRNDSYKKWLIYTFGNQWRGQTPEEISAAVNFALSEGKECQTRGLPNDALP